MEVLIDNCIGTNPDNFANFHAIFCRQSFQLILIIFCVQLFTTQQRVCEHTDKDTGDEIWELGTNWESPLLSSCWGVFFAHYISNVHFENRGKIFLIAGRWLSETERLLIVYRVVFVEVGQPDDEAWLFASWVLGLVFITSLGSISDSVSSINSSFQSWDLTEQFTFILQVV